MQCDRNKNNNNKKKKRKGPDGRVGGGDRSVFRGGEAKG